MDVSGTPRIDLQECWVLTTVFENAHNLGAVRNLQMMQQLANLLGILRRRIVIKRCNDCSFERGQGGTVLAA